MVETNQASRLTQHRTGEEIRSLSRFQVVQRTGFAKILKKYKRWTKDRELSHIFRDEVSSQPESLFQLDLSYLLDQYIEVLDVLRSVFDADGAPAASNGTNGQSPAAHLSRSIMKGQEIDFDVALTTVPLGSNGAKAMYWVHPDHIVEVQVLLLQQMRLYTSTSRATSRNGSTRATPVRRQSSINNLHFGIEDDVGLVVLDHAEAFAVKQNSGTIGASEETEGTIGTKAAGHIRYVASGKAAVVACTDSKEQGQSMEVRTVKLERKGLQTLLDTPQGPDMLQHANSPTEQPNGHSKDECTEIQQWLKEHKYAKPIAGAISKRTRFIGLHNNSSGGVWAALDREVYLKESLHKNLEGDDWVSTAVSQSTAFPHAILEVRKEGRHASSLIQTLDHSHLVERVRGFSLEAHAVWVCCRPSTMSPPLWIPLLDKDIRKLPELARRRSRRTQVTSGSSQSQSSPPLTLTSNTSYDGQSSPIASRNGGSSVTSAQDFVDPPNLQAFRKKGRKPYAEYPPPIARAEPEPEPQRYWNEYDHPEDEETGYYIYIDPNASVKFPGQELMEAWMSKTRKILGLRERPARGSFSAYEDASSDDDDDTADNSPTLAATNYGAIPPRHRNGANKGYFSSIFRSQRQPHDDVDMLHERHSLLSQLEMREHGTEMTKLRFYSTSLATAIIIDVILGIMTVTSRKKERGVVDVVVLFGTMVTLMLCVVGVLSMKTRRERLGWVHQCAVLSIAGSVVALDVLLLLWVLRI